MYHEQEDFAFLYYADQTGWHMILFQGDLLFAAAKNITMLPV